MVFRKPPFVFGTRSVKKRTTKYIVNDLPKTPNDLVYPQIPFLIRSVKYKIKTSVDNTPAGQLFSFTFKVSELFRDERIKLNYNKAAEIRPQVERLIVEALRHGDRHRPTMDLANYWLRDRSLVHKLFKVFVPRYSNYASAFTALHVLGHDYSLCGLSMTDRQKSTIRFFAHGGEAILEMRGNPLPPIIRPKLDKTGLLTNILIDGARLSNRPPENARSLA